MGLIFSRASTYSFNSSLERELQSPRKKALAGPSLSMTLSNVMGSSIVVSEGAPESSSTSHRILLLELTRILGKIRARNDAPSTIKHKISKAGKNIIPTGQKSGPKSESPEEE